MTEAPLELDDAAWADGEVCDQCDGYVAECACEPDLDVDDPNPWRAAFGAFPDLHDPDELRHETSEEAFFSTPLKRVNVGEETKPCLTCGCDGCVPRFGRARPVASATCPKHGVGAIDPNKPPPETEPCPECTMPRPARSLCPVHDR